jgi:hypothetical protein
MRALILLVLSLASVGCDPAYGLRRHAYVGHLPDPARIRAIVQETLGIDSVTYRHYEGGFPTMKEYYFDYKGGADVRGELLFRIDSRKRIEYSQSLISLLEPPPQQYIDATLPVMKRIELRLERKAGLPGLQSSVKQDWIRIVCP